MQLQSFLYNDSVHESITSISKRVWTTFNEFTGETILAPDMISIICVHNQIFHWNTFGSRSPPELLDGTVTTLFRHTAFEGVSFEAVGLSYSTIVWYWAVLGAEYKYRPQQIAPNAPSN